MTITSKRILYVPERDQKNTAMFNWSPCRIKFLDFVLLIPASSVLNTAHTFIAVSKRGRDVGVGL